MLLYSSGSSACCCVIATPTSLKILGVGKKTVDYLGSDSLGV